jgi:hypothetical protein
MGGGGVDRNVRDSGVVRVLLIHSGPAPDHGLPVTAAGLRGYGLAEGLRSHGFLVNVLAVAAGGRRREAAEAGAEVVRARDVAGRVTSLNPGVVVVIDPLRMPELPQDGFFCVLDFCSTGLLEYAGDRAAWARERSRLVEAVGSADALIVSGAPKVPHYLAWALQAKRDVLTMPIRLVEFCLPAAEREPRQGQDGLGLVIFVDSDEDLLMAADVVRQHAGHDLKATVVPSLRRAGATGELSDHDEVRVLPAPAFDELRGVLSEADLAVELPVHTLAAQYRGAADAAAALTSGVPVVYPSFGEMADAVSEYEAGWLVDDVGEVDALLGSLRDDPASVRGKAQGAARLAATRLDPATAVRPLVEIIEGAA